MQVSSERAARITANAKRIASLQFVADFDLPAFEVSVKRRESVAVVENHIATVTLAAALIADLDDLACECGDDSAVFAMAETEIDTAVHAVLARAVMTGNAAAFRRNDGCRHVKHKKLFRSTRRSGISRCLDIGISFGIFACSFFGIETIAVENFVA